MQRDLFASRAPKGRERRQGQEEDEGEKDGGTCVVERGGYRDERDAAGGSDGERQDCGSDVKPEKCLSGDPVGREAK